VRSVTFFAFGFGPNFVDDTSELDAEDVPRSLRRD
jgi:hypothetical protein